MELLSSPWALGLFPKEFQKSMNTPFRSNILWIDFRNDPEARSHFLLISGDVSAKLCWPLEVFQRELMLFPWFSTPETKPSSQTLMGKGEALAARSGCCRGRGIRDFESSVPAFKSEQIMWLRGRFTRESLPKTSGWWHSLTVIHSPPTPCSLSLRIVYVSKNKPVWNGLKQIMEFAGSLPKVSGVYGFRCGWRQRFTIISGAPWIWKPCVHFKC